MYDVNDPMICYCAALKKSDIIDLIIDHKDFSTMIKKSNACCGCRKCENSIKNIIKEYQDG